ncbi:remodeling and spacing factor 1 [Ditylenchus destructor]|nr:remodeling and spacing factor 1 [Ditylenchus destructor]
MKEESGFEEPQPSTSTAEDVKDVKIEPSLENGPKQEVEDEENGDAQDQKPVKSEDDEEEEGEESEIEETHLDASLLYQEPVYAEVCSFFNLFGALMGMKPISFSRIDKMFCTFHNGQVDTELIDLHIQLMRKIYLKSARADKWEQSLLKFCSVCPSLESELLELERYNYVDLPLSVKLSVLKALCESQFDCNVKFKENIFNTYQTGEMRLAPIGVDKHGLSYYYQQDYELNIRVYTVEPDDMSGGTWTLRAKSKNELLFLIDSLKSPDFGKKQDSKEDDEDIDEDQIVNQNAKHADKHGDAASKSEIDIKPAPPALEMSEEQKREVQMTTKRFTFWDLYQDGSHLNKAKYF